MDTRFSAEVRDPFPKVLSEYEILLDSPIINGLLNALPYSAVVLNPHRQIVFSNSRLKLPVDDIKGIIGCRPGEALQCIRSREKPAGCGASDHCSVCGAAQTLTKAESLGRRVSGECRVVTVTAGMEAIDLRITACPLQVEGFENYLLVTFEDISDEKRRQALERVFFHDVLNSAGALAGFLAEVEGSDIAELSNLLPELRQIASHLLAEIEAQRDLARAEHNELQLCISTSSTAVVLQELVLMFKQTPLALNREIQIEENIPDAEMLTDLTLLRRILINMLRNACEASTHSQPITAGCSLAGDKVEYWVHNSRGMNTEERLQIFQRSFSTKGNGRGLGTYSMKLLGERYLGGAVTFETDPSSGTTFRIRIPRKLAPTVNPAKA